jgi:serine phosphatase RsbU (regulator of sigma subunit)
MPQFTKFLLLFAVLFASAFFATAQKKQIDSLAKLLLAFEQKTQFASDTNYLILLNEFTAKQQAINPDSMLILGMKAVDLCEKAKYNKGVFESNRNVGIAYWVKGNYTEALVYYQKALAVVANTGYDKEKGKVYHHIAKVYTNQGKYPDALENHFEALKIDEKLDDKKGIAFSLNNIANVYRNQNKYEDALNYYQKSLEISKLAGNQKSIAYSMEGIADVYKRQKKYKEALDYYLTSIKIEQELDDKRGVAYCLDGMAAIYNKQENYVESTKSYEQALVINKKLGDKSAIIRSLQGVAESKIGLKQYDSAILYLQEGLEIAQKIGHKERIRDYNELLGNIYEIKQDYTKALFFHKQFKLYADSLNNKEIEQKTANLAAQYAYEKKEVLLKDEHERQSLQFRWIIISVLGGLFSVLVIVFLVWRSRKKVQIAYDNIALANAEILQKNEEIEQQTENLLMANQEISVKNEQVEKALLNIQTISEIGQKVTASLDLETVIQLVYENVNTLMDATCFGIGVYIPTKQHLVFQGFIERKEVLPTHTEEVNPANLTFAALCLLEQKEVLIQDIVHEAGQYGVEVKAQSGDLPKSLIYLPLVVENKAVGVITVQSFVANSYGEAEINILKALASYISIAVSNSQSYEIIEKKNRHITDSIRYAQTIQQAMLPNKKELFDALKAYFIVYKPRDIVSGDFYWVSNRKEGTFVAVADCTGHGVPGAFMSMIGISFLHEAINQQALYEPATILSYINNEIRNALKQEETNNRDGMDLVLCKINAATNNLEYEVTFAGAKRPLLYKTANEMCEIKGSRKNIGGISNTMNFEQHKLLLYKDDILYLSTDGYADQANEKRDSFGSKKLYNLLDTIADKTMQEQEAILLETLHQHQKGVEQRDDITMMGIRLSV